MTKVKLLESIGYSFRTRISDFEEISGFGQQIAIMPLVLVWLRKVKGKRDEMCV